MVFIHKLSSKDRYILSYSIIILILPFVIFLFTGINIQLMDEVSLDSEFIMCFLLITELIIFVSGFNFIAYQLNLDKPLKSKENKILKSLIIANLMISTMIVLIMEFVI